jgi:hypothetical protein
LKYSVEEMMDITGLMTDDINADLLNVSNLISIKTRNRIQL